MRRTLALGLVVLVGLGGFGVAHAGPGGSVASVIVPTDPYRILDTRTGVGTGGTVGPLGPGQAITLQVAGVGPVPADATGVVLNLTVDNADEPGSYITAWPTGAQRPDTSVINIVPGQATANMITANLGDGKLDLYNFRGHVNLIADVAGYLLPSGSDGAGGGLVGPQGPPGPTAGSFQSVAPHRKLSSNDYVVLQLADPGTGGLIDATFPARLMVNASVTITGAASQFESPAQCVAQFKDSDAGAAFASIGQAVIGSAGFGGSSTIAVVGGIDVPEGVYDVRVICNGGIFADTYPTVETANMTVTAVAQP